MILDVLSAYPTTKQPLKIIVTGGSVTAAHGTSNANPFGVLIGPQKWNFPWKECAWSARLESIINNVFFGGEPAVRILNVARGGVSSHVATMTFQYGLLPDEFRDPHIVLLAHSANDAKVVDGDAVFYDHMQGLVRAANRLNTCHDDMPLVAWVDDFYSLDPAVGSHGVTPTRAMGHTSKMFALSSWHQTMMISYGNGPEGVNSDWKKELIARDEACKSKDANHEICTYAWMVGLAEVTSTDGVTSALQGNLKHNNGWNASMLPVDKPRVGWFALIEKASFSLAIPVNTDTNYVTVLSLVSYGPNFVGTNLNLSIKVYEGGGSFAQNKSNSESLYDISGYHETKSSIDVPHKFKLQQGARKGDVVEIKGTLTSGAHFRISGLALCRL